MKLPEMPSASPADAGLRRHYVRRLERLVRLRRDFADDLNPLGLALLDRSIQATYIDCVDNGATRAARALLPRPR